MISRYEVTLNGVSLASIHPMILITDVNYEPPAYERETYTIANRQGSRITPAHKEAARVTISFAIRSYPIEERQSVCQDVIRWARDGGDLRINDRPGQFLDCVCDQLPTVESVRNWTDNFTVVFAAYTVPYWQEVTPTVLTVHLADGAQVQDDTGYTELTMTVPGNAPSVVLDAVVAPDDTTAPKQYIEIITGENDFVSDGYALQGDGIESYHFEHDEHGYLRAFINQINGGAIVPRSQMWAVKGADDLICPCGRTVQIKVRYGQRWDTYNPAWFQPYACTITLTARGLWE